MKRPLFIYPLLLLHLFIGLGAVYGGAMLVLKPDGSLLGMQSNWLADSPFNNYLLPGLILLVFNGLLPLLTSVGLFFKPHWPGANIFNLYSHQHWAWAFSLYSGIISIIWIIVQQVLTQYFWIQPVILSVALVIIIFTLTPPEIRHFAVKD